MTIGIIGGGGTVGSCMAFALAFQDFLEEIVLTDVRQNVVRGQIMDLEPAMTLVSRTKVSRGEPDDLRRCDVVIVAASAPDDGGSERTHRLRENIEIVRSVAQCISEFCRNAVIITASNPVDVLNFVLWRATGLPRERFLGFSLNDSLRFRWALASVLKVPAPRVRALAIGEHGAGQVLLFSTVTVDGCHVKLSDARRRQVSDVISSWFDTYVTLRSGRTTGWTSAVSGVLLVNEIVAGSIEPIGLSVIPCGEYGLADISIGLPTTLNRAGVKAIVDLELTDEELMALTSAAANVQRLIRQTESGLQSRQGSSP